MNRILLLLLAFTWTFTSKAQVKSPEQMGGVYYAYPVWTTLIDPTPPAGYKPFYISHYGRHGSRWLPSDARYEWVCSQFADKRNLTSEGKRLRKQLAKVWRNARGNGGQLTNLGARQHWGIANRMADNFPEVFVSGSRVHARSSVVPRCKASMESFINSLLNQCPGLVTDVATDSADMRYIAYTTPGLHEIEKTVFPKMLGSPDRLMKLLFKDPSSVDEPVRLMSELHTIASDMQDIGDPALRVSLYWLFTDDEMADIYARNNERMAYCNGDDPRTGGEPARSALSLWEDIETRADKAVAAAVPAADLRFGHDTNLYRLLSLIQASSAKSGKMDEILPMAANLQMIFFRNAEGDVIVRLLHNERDFSIPVTPVMGHYYRWSGIKSMMSDRIHRLEHEQHLNTLNTMVGTAQANTKTAGMFGKGSEEHGQTLPAVLTPNGQNFWTPQTQPTEKKCVAPYYYADTLFYGMRSSHWIVGGCTQDYGSFTVTAIGGDWHPDGTAHTTRFSHADEVSHPHYYSVRLPDEHLRLELTATDHGALLCITPDRDQLVHVVLQPNSDEGLGVVDLRPSGHAVYASNPVHRIYQGWGEEAGFSGHILMSYSDNPIKYGCIVADKMQVGATHAGASSDVGACLSFQGRANQPIMLRMATSFTGYEGCDVNMKAEIEGKSFNQIMTETAKTWIDRLHTIDVETDDEAAVRQFYGALYRTSFLPRLLSDADGSYPAFSKGTVMRSPRPRYTDFSMWDTYRALHPLYNIIAPKQSADMMQSIVGMAQEGGWLPIFPCWNSYTAAMIGDHCAAALADAYVKGIRDFDAVAAYSAMRRNAFESPADDREYADGMGRRALKSYIKYGYIPMEDPVAEAFHTDEQTSRTLEYAFDDFAVAQMARLLGKTDDYNVLMKRAANWSKVINPLTGYADGRHVDGRFENNTDFVHRKSYITEGATCHYTWYVPHQPETLVRMMGGNDVFVARLDSMFTEGRYWHGNEPCHQVPYMFCFAGRPDLTQRWVRHILETEYNDTPGGLSGNDDAGQMSAWYVFSAMGFYPVCPATDQYIIGSPLFRKVCVNQPGGRTFTIEAPDADDTRLYVVDATVDGKPVSDSRLSHGDITRGATLRLSMSAEMPDLR